MRTGRQEQAQAKRIPIHNLVEFSIVGYRIGKSGTGTQEPKMQYVNDMPNLLPGESHFPTNANLKERNLNGVRFIDENALAEITTQEVFRAALLLEACTNAFNDSTNLLFMAPGSMVPNTHSSTFTALPSACDFMHDEPGNS